MDQTCNNVWLIKPQAKLRQWVEKLSQLLASSDTLFIIDDINADEKIDKWSQSLLELAISDSHSNHYLWLLTQSYSVILEKSKKAG